MIILDSNIWIAVLNENDSLHQRAVALFENIEEEVILHEYIIVEVCNVLLLRKGKKNADEFLDSMLKDGLYVLYSSPSVFEEVCTFFRNRTEKNLSFIDTTLLYYSHDYQVYTFDKHLQKAIQKLRGEKKWP